MRNLCFFQKCTVAYSAASNVVMGSSRGVKHEFLDCGLTILWVTHLLSPDNCIYFFLFQPHVSEDVGVVPQFSLLNYSSFTFPTKDHDDKVVVLLCSSPCAFTSLVFSTLLHLVPIILYSFVRLQF